MTLGLLALAIARAEPVPEPPPVTEGAAAAPSGEAPPVDIPNVPAPVPHDLPPARRAAPAAAAPATPSVAPSDETPRDAPILADEEDAEAFAAEDPPRDTGRSRRPARRRGEGERWIRRQIPDSLEVAGPMGLEWWQLLAVPVLALVSAGLGRGLGVVSRNSIRRVVRATPAQWDDELLARSGGPLTLAWAVGIAWMLARFLYFQGEAAVVATQALQIAFLLSLVWVGIRGADILGEAATRAAHRDANPGAASVVPLLVRAGKIGLVAMAVVTVLSSLGYPVASLLTGLGIGGLALALAAQKTAENVFGSVSIGVDQPFRVGDLVKIEDFTGVVEAIGLRSTRIRTPERSVITLPNGRLADMRVENLTLRDRMRLFCVLGLEYGTPVTAVRAVLAKVDARLRGHPRIWPEGTSVRLVRLSHSSLDVEVNAWFSTADPGEWAAMREELLLGLLDDVAAAGAQLAFPTTTVRVAR